MTATDPAIAAMERRIENLNREIEVAQAKLPRAHAAIRSRQTTLARLQAQLALARESRLTHAAHE
ncbi:MAG: hypothetical protein DVB25_08320 [Verrucomicrobia bacterium]|nr:MAG: hypothetical protein DVB25_08320 [Verrucomicrobiota bacterium]